MSWFHRRWEDVARALFGAAPPAEAPPAEAPPAEAPPAEALSETARETAPVLWLLGKTGAGKTAIVAALTGDSRAEIGTGFKPCTRTANRYDAPAEAPLLRFLDTRGLEEANYDPTADMAWCEARAHCLLAVVRAEDRGQAAVLTALREVRQRHPDWPVVVAQTCLHSLYSSGEHHPPAGTPLPEHVRAALEHQQKAFNELFKRLPGPAPRFVPLDFTEAEDGIEPRLYGLAELEDALLVAGLGGIAAMAAARADSGSDAAGRRARASIYAYAGLAAGAGALPVPLAGAAGLAALQAAMLQALARHCGMEWTQALFGRLGAALGTGTLGWFGLRYALAELAKGVPVLGTITAGAINAASAAAFTAGLGEAAWRLLRSARRGQEAPPEELKRAYTEAFWAWRRRHP